MFRGLPLRVLSLQDVTTNPSLQIFSGCVPFHHITNDYQIMSRIISGRRPPRPILSEPSRQSCKSLGLNDHMWLLIEACWSIQPEHRPTANEAVDRLPRRKENMDILDGVCSSRIPASSASENVIAWAISCPHQEIDPDSNHDFSEAGRVLPRLYLTSNLS